MHSTKGFSAKLMVLTLVTILAQPIGALAKDPEPKGIDNKIAAIDKLEDEIDALEKQLAAEQKKSEPDETRVQTIRETIWAKEAEMKNYERDLKSGVKRYNRVVELEGKIAEYEKMLAEGKTTFENGTPVADEIKRLKAKIGRKEKRYNRRVGEEMAKRCKKPEGRDPVKNICRACTKLEYRSGDGDCQLLTAKDCKADEVFDAKEGCLAKCGEGEERLPTLKCAKVCAANEERDEKAPYACKAKPKTVAEKRKNPACWVEASDKPAKVYALYPMGESELVLRKSPTGTPSATSMQHGARAFFEKQIEGLNGKLGQYGRISKLYATSYLSKAQYTKNSTTRSKDLAMARSLDAMDSLFQELGLVHGRTESSDADPKPILPVEIKNRNEVEPIKLTGPAWKSGDVEKLSQKSVTPKDIERVAKEIQSGKYGFTPVKGKDLAETRANLELCCQSDMAVLTYQPYQYTQLLVTLPEFKPDSEACKNPKVDSSKVATKTGDKCQGSRQCQTETGGTAGAEPGMIPGCVPDADNDCRARNAN